MAILASDVIGALNHLVSICLDGEKGYALASEHEKHLQHRDLYRQYSRQRAKMIQELKDEIRNVGGDPVETGTMSGAAHRGWIGMRTGATGDAEFSIAAECERGEDAAVHAYEDALKHDLPKAVSDLLIRQYSLVKASHDKVKQIRDFES